MLNEIRFRKMNHLEGATALRPKRMGFRRVKWDERTDQGSCVFDAGSGVIAVIRVLDCGADWRRFGAAASGRSGFDPVSQCPEVGWRQFIACKSAIIGGLKLNISNWFLILIDKKPGVCRVFCVWSHGIRSWLSESQQLMIPSLWFILHPAITCDSSKVWKLGAGSVQLFSNLLIYK